MKNMNRHSVWIYLCVVAWGLQSCKTSDQLILKTTESLPQHYTQDHDTTVEKLASWRNIFFDSALVALIDTALVNNYDVRAAFQKVEIARSGVQYYRGARLPEINASAAAGIRKFGDYTMDGVGNYDTQFSPNINSKQQIPNPLPDYFLGFQSSWEIDLWGRIKNKKKAAAARFMASQFGKDLVVTNMVAEVANTYFELMAVDEELRIIEDNIELQQKALDVVTVQKDAARANELAVELLQAQLLSSKSVRVEALQKQIAFESKLSFLCSWYPRNIPRDTALSNVPMVNILHTGVPSNLLKNRPDIRQAEMELVAAHADLQSARMAFYPSFQLNAALGLQSFNAHLLIETPASLAYNVLSGLTAPLINRRKIKSDLMNAKAEQKHAYIGYEKTVVNGFVEVYNAISEIKNTRDLYELKKQEVEVLKKSVVTATELFKAGRANYLEIIVAQQNALQSQLDLVHYRKKQYTAIVNLYRSLGGGWEWE